MRNQLKSSQTPPGNRGACGFSAASRTGSCGISLPSFQHEPSLLWRVFYTGGQISMSSGFPSATTYRKSLSERKVLKDFGFLRYCSCCRRKLRKSFSFLYSRNTWRMNSLVEAKPCSFASFFTSLATAAGSEMVVMVRMRVYYIVIHL